MVSAEDMETLFFGFVEYGSDSTCTGQEYGPGQDSVKEHAHALGNSYLQYLAGGSPGAMASLELSPDSGTTAISANPMVPMPKHIGRCFEGDMNVPTQKAFYSWGCGTGSEMFLLGFDTLDECRDAFYCSVQNPSEVMRSEVPVAQDDPFLSCETKLLAAVIPFLGADQDTKLDAGKSYLSVQNGDPPCVQLPLSAPGGKSAYRVYMGCTRSADEAEFENPANLTAGEVDLTLYKYDPRGEGIWNLKFEHKAGVYAANFLGWTLCICLICLSLRPVIREKMKGRRHGVAVTSSKGGEA